MKSSITDVARRANVSTATVSRVINNNGSVKPLLRARVLRAIEELDYEPSGIARNMRNQSKRTIGLIIADVQNPFFTDMVRAIEETAYEHQYTVLLGSSANQVRREQLYLNLLVQERVAGVVVVPLATDPGVYQFRRTLPMVFLDRAVPGVNADAVLLDNHRGGAMAAEHLLSFGHEHIGLVSAPLAHGAVDERQEGFRSALERAGLRHDPALSQWGNDIKEAGGFNATLELLALKPRPTALFAVNNVRTLGMLRAISAAGLRVPDDVSVIGFDDSPWLSLLSPPLTTIGQPVYEMANEAVRLLMRRIGKNSDSPQVVTRMAPTLVVRESVIQRA